MICRIIPIFCFKNIRTCKAHLAVCWILAPLCQHFVRHSPLLQATRHPKGFTTWDSSLRRRKPWRITFINMQLGHERQISIPICTDLPAHIRDWDILPPKLLPPTYVVLSLPLPNSKPTLSSHRYLHWDKYSCRVLLCHTNSIFIYRFQWP